MGRNKLILEKIENPSTREATYSKRKYSILKKLKELSTLCDTDVAVMMFSPSGRLNSFVSNGRLKSIVMEEPDHDEETFLSTRSSTDPQLQQSAEELAHDWQAGG